jgi:hypothetical protein
MRLREGGVLTLKRVGRQLLGADVAKDRGGKEGRAQLGARDIPAGGLPPRHVPHRFVPPPYLPSTPCSYTLCTQQMSGYPSLHIIFPFCTTTNRNNEIILHSQYESKTSEGIKSPLKCQHEHADRGSILEILIKIRVQYCKVSKKH